jgi:opacity protein-like surface antigen
MNHLLAIFHHTPKTMCTMLIILLSVSINAQQPDIKTDDDPKNPGGTISITTTTTGEWTKKVEERKNKEGRTLDIFTVEETPDTRRRQRTIMFDKNGDTSYVFYSIFDRNSDLTYVEMREYRGKKLVQDEKKWLNPGDKKYKWYILNPNGTYGDYGEKQPHANWDQSQAEPEKKPTVCPPRHEVEVDYNYLNLAQGGGERLSVPLGARLDYGYNLSGHLSLHADVTYNVLKEEDIRQMWMFLLFGVNYKCSGSVLKDGLRVKPKTVEPYAEARVGAVRRRYKYIDPAFLSSLEWNFTGALGGGVDINIGTKTKINLGGDYIPIWYDGKMESNFRLYGGIQFNFGCRQ